ncbi:MAG TPA: sulfite exporter TauE/SafE family protein [Polyangiaceae bacterium]|nr:sulfite exporter TauE/SafE family protein [Polyangiaceae bacterium]
MNPLGYDSLAQWLLATAVVTTAAALQGSAGFGFSLLSAPILAWQNPRLVPAPLILAGTLLLGLTAWRERSAVDLKGIGWLLGGRLPGTVAGVFALAALSERALTTGLGLFVLAAVGISIGSGRFSRTPRLLAGVGIVSGFMGVTSAIDGPPVAVLYQHEHGALVRSTLATYFLAGAAMSIAALTLVGKIGRGELGLALGLWPGIALGFTASRWLGRWLDRGRTRGALLSVAACAGLAAVLHGLA